MKKPDTFLAAFDLINGEPDPDNARLLLERYCHAFDNQEEIPYELFLYLRNSFRRYLDKEVNKMDVALGLLKKKGRPKADSQVRINMATEVLRSRLQGKSHQDALYNASEKLKCCETTVGEAWAAWKQTAIIQIRMERPTDKYPWTKEEIERVDKIFSKESWYRKTSET